jgi:hypothetical protein
VQALLSTLKLVQKDATRKRFAALSRRTMTADHLQRSEASKAARLAELTDMQAAFEKQKGAFRAEEDAAATFADGRAALLQKLAVCS